MDYLNSKTLREFDQCIIKSAPETSIKSIKMLFSLFQNCVNKLIKNRKDGDKKRNENIDCVIILAIVK